MLRKRLQLGLIHAAVAMTLVPINSTLNRVMIKELVISATLVAVLASLPYLFSPIQVVIGSFSDRHPFFGYRRSPYILVGLLLCAAGLILSPQAAFLLGERAASGLIIGILAFGAWGMGFNLATVSYFSLASELSGEEGHGQTVAIMFFMMISSIIITAIALSQMVDPFTPSALVYSFRIVAAVAFSLGVIGLLSLENPSKRPPQGRENYSWSLLYSFILSNRQATHFFLYLIILLIALLGQDILLEPFGGEAFGLEVTQTTRITSIWGTCVLAALLLGGVLERRASKLTIAKIGGWGALFGFVVVLISGIVISKGLFFSGIILLGIGTGLSTVANLSLMFDMTTADKVGLYMGAWGMANAISRLLGSVLGGALRDLIGKLSGNMVLGYLAVFGMMAGVMLISVLMLNSVNVSAFRRQAQTTSSLVEKAALISNS